MKEIIKFNNFTFKYAKSANPTLKGLNLSIYEGEKILIVGRSGCGKSTLTRCINGLIPKVNKGEITGSLEINSSNIGTILQDSDTQFVARTVGEDIAFILENNNVSTEDMKRKVNTISRLVDMSEFLESKPQDLSGGQKQRVALAGVLVSDSDVLLFDEPLANLDPKSGQEAIKLISEIHDKTNATVIIVEHRVEDVLSLGIDRIVLMDKGEIVSVMKTEDMISSGLLAKHGIREPLDVVAKRYMSSPSFFNNYSVNSYEKKENNPLIEITNLNFTYDDEYNAIKDISFNIYEGEMISIVGKNGAGKSTIANILCGFETGYTGKILYKGMDLSKYSISERAKFLGYVMQNPNHMISKQTVKEEVEFSLKLRGVSDNEIEERLTKILKLCGIYQYRNWPITALSYGQKKRTTIASILILEPKVLILDEPTAAQDYMHYLDIMEFLKELNEKEGITIIMVTHDMHLMLEYTTRSIVLLDGHLIYNGSPVEALLRENVYSKANLCQTSLYSLARSLKLDEYSFVQSFINYERDKRK